MLLARIAEVLPKLDGGSHANLVSLTPTFTPDFTATCSAEVAFVAISAGDYLRAYRASQIDRPRAQGELLAEKLTSDTATNASQPQLHEPVNDAAVMSNVYVL